MLTQAQGNKLLKLARNSIKTWFEKKQLNFSQDKKEFSQNQGVFVTLTLYGDLRGCIGFPYPTSPLAEAVFEAARSAAFSDPRFKSITEQEFKKVKIEISVLSVPEKINAVGNQIPGKIKIGQDGLIIQFSGFSGLLLPQVATEYKWNTLQFLEAICQKAGLPSNSWLNPNCQLFKFQAQIFKEKSKKK
jgi:hypothetical protein